MNPKKSHIQGFFSNPKNLWFIAPILAFIVLSPSLQNTWVNWDDSAYVLENSAIHEWSWDGIQTMFKTPNVVGNYHPITLMSLAFDYALAGENSSFYHWHSLILHLTNTVLLFFFIQKLFKHATLSLIVSLFFAVHPMHVESVAWISARKDLLYAFYLLLAFHGYSSFIRSKGKAKAKIHFALVFLFFLLALLSKSMAIVFPAYLLLIDHVQGRKLTRAVLLEKVPFLILSLFFIGLTLYTQNLEGAIAHDLEIGFIPKLAIAFYSIFLYLAYTIAPINLSGFHPYPFQLVSEIPSYIYFSLIFLPILSLAIYWSWKKRHRFLLFSLLFFLVSIAPVLQILPHGRALIAERYTYMAYIGPFVFLGILLLNGIQSKKKGLQIASIASILLSVFSFSLKSNEKSRIWKNGETLWTDVIKQYPEDYFAYYSRAEYFAQKGMWAKSMSDLQKSIQLYPYFCYSLNLRARAFEKKGETKKAVQDYQSAIQAEPKFGAPYLNLAKLWEQSGQIDSALKILNQALHVHPNYSEAFVNRGVIYEKVNQGNLALKDYSSAIQLEPVKGLYYRYRGVYLLSQNQLDSAIQDFSKCILYRKKDKLAYFLRAKAYQFKGEKELAIQDAKRSLQLNYKEAKMLLLELNKN